MSESQKRSSCSHSLFELNHRVAVDVNEELEGCLPCSADPVRLLSQTIASLQLWERCELRLVRPSTSEEAPVQGDELFGDGVCGRCCCTLVVACRVRGYGVRLPIS